MSKNKKTKTKKVSYKYEVKIGLWQLLFFYGIPIIAILAETDVSKKMLFSSTMLLSFVLGIMSESVMKYIYPIGISLSFIPSAFWFFSGNTEQVGWYFIAALCGVAIGDAFAILFGVREEYPKLKKVKKEVKKQEPIESKEEKSPKETEEIKTDDSTDTVAVIEQPKKVDRKDLPRNNKTRYMEMKDKKKRKRKKKKRK